MRLVKPSMLPIQPKSRPSRAQWIEWVRTGAVDGKVLPDGTVLVDENRFLGTVDFTVQTSTTVDLLS